MVPEGFDILYEEGRFKESTVELERVVEYATDNDRAWCALGIVYDRLEDKRALHAWETYLSLSAGDKPQWDEHARRRVRTLKARSAESN